MYQNKTSVIMSVEEIIEKLSKNHLKIPKPYYAFCMYAFYVLKDGEDLNSLSKLIDDLADYHVSTANAVESFVLNCSDQTITNELQYIYEKCVEDYNKLVREIREFQAPLEEGEIYPEWA
jgi:hypothetical protein